MIDKPFRNAFTNCLFYSVFALAVICFSTIDGFNQQKREYIILSHPNNKAVTDHIGHYAALGKFSDSYGFIIDLAGMPAENNADISLAGMLGAGIEYRLTKYSVDSRSVSFETEMINDVRFKFEGIFLKKGNLTRFYRQATPVLKGTLTKYISDKKDSTTAISFRFRALKAPYYLPNVEPTNSN